MILMNFLPEQVSPLDIEIVSKLTHIMIYDFGPNITEVSFVIGPLKCRVQQVVNEVDLLLVSGSFTDIIIAIV